MSLGAAKATRICCCSRRCARGRARVLRPVDHEPGPARDGLRRRTIRGFPAQGIKADFTNPTHLKALAAEPETPPRLVLLIGNTLGAFDPIAEARDLARLLRPGDTLLVDGEVYAGDATVAGYDNPLNRRFAWAPLNGRRHPRGRR